MAEHKTGKSEPVINGKNHAKNNHPVATFLGDIFPVVMRYTGLGIAIWEVIVQQVDRPSLLLLAAGMMGLDSVIDAAGIRKRGE